MCDLASAGFRLGDRDDPFMVGNGNFPVGLSFFLSLFEL